MFRRMKEKDLNDYKDMTLKFYQTDAVLSTIDHKNIERTFHEIIRDSPYVGGFVCEIENEIAGYALLSFTYSNTMGGLVLLLEELYIKEVFRGQGLGKSFLKYLEDVYKDEIVAMRLEVTNDNTHAIRLYSDLGFEDVFYLQMKKRVS